MLTRFKVEGFKSLLDVSVDLGVVNVFIGANGSGKSNLLEALGVLGAAVSSSVEPETLRYRGVRLGLPALYKSSFKSKSAPEAIVLEARTDNVTYRLGLSNPTDAPEVRWRVHGEYINGLELFPQSHVYETLARSVLMTFKAYGRQELQSRDGLQRLDVGDGLALLDALVDFAIFAPSTSVLRGISRDIARDPLGLEGSGLPLAIQSLLDKEQQQLGPFDLDEVWELVEWAQDMAAVPGTEVPVSPAVPTTPTVLKFVDRFMNVERNTLSAYDASEGALYVLFLLALVSHPHSPRLFAIDNFDHALHPRLASRLIHMVTQQMLRDGTRQMLMTTHNPLVLDGLDLRDPRIRLFAVERDAQGATQVHRIELTEALLQEAERGLSLSRLWVMGRLGAVPRVL